MYITNGRVFGGPRTFLYFGYFLTIWAFQSKQLTGHLQFTQNYKIMIQWRKIISFYFHHIPKLSIGFKYPFMLIMVWAWPPVFAYWTQQTLQSETLIPKGTRIRHVKALQKAHGRLLFERMIRNYTICCWPIYTTTSNYFQPWSPFC